MEINDVIHGFSITNIRKVNELNAVLYEMTYEKNGALLAYLDRPDDNKTFSIAFKTIAENDTGVPHILEHSVLNGSAKYPVKEPFVELLKGSLQTFLNAMTYPDKTVYPVSSRNDQDFLNLMDVYLDAVLHPAFTKKPEIFYQEGWHYELADKNDELKFNGVVYNEMKGSYSSVDTVVMSEMFKLLFPSNGYRFESGGEPTHIPELTYEYFLACHRRFYHPSNSRIFLDGTMDIDTVLAKIDSFLTPYEKLDIDAEISMQEPIEYKEITKPYEIAATDKTEGKTQIAIGSVFCTYEDRVDIIAANIIADVLCGTNESPLKKMIIDAGLAEEVQLQVLDGILQPMTIMIVQNTDKEKLDEVKNTIDTTVKRLAADGLDRELLTASLNNLEFRMREKDYGSYPIGVAFATSTLETWLYGGDPLTNIVCDEAFASVRSRLDGDYFERLMLKMLTDSKHKALVCMVPSRTLGEEKLKNEAERLAAIRADWSDAKVDEIVEMNRKLKRWQETDDTPEQLACLPTLEISDIPEKPEKLEQEVSAEDGVTVLYHDVKTSGITYADLYFKATGLTSEEYSCLSFLCDVLCHTDTQNYDSFALQNKIKEQLGNLSVSATVLTKSGETETCEPVVVVNCSVLDSKRGEAVRLIPEVLNNSVFTNRQIILNFLRQKKFNVEQAFIAAGNQFALLRTGAYLTSGGAVSEYMAGYENYQWIKKYEADFDNQADGLCNMLKSICEKLFIRSKLTLSVTGAKDDDFKKALIRTIPDKKAFAEEPPIKAFGVRQEGIIIPAAVSFAVEADDLNLLNCGFTGNLCVAANLLTYGYLWNAIRVQGGAYGTGFIARFGGRVGFYSFRDPNAARSLDCYAGASEYLREFCKNYADLDKYIIGAIGDTDPLLSPKTRGRTAAIQYLSGYTYADACRVRSEILRVTPANMDSVCDILMSISDKRAICVVAGKDKIDACGDKLSAVLSL